MANLFEQKDRNVIPNWRSYKSTLYYGELINYVIERPIPPTKILSIDDYLLSWEQNKNISIAGDLLSAAFVNGFTENDIVKEAANFIIENKSKSADTMFHFAEDILNPDINKSYPDEVNPANINDCIDKSKVILFIKELKEKINNYPLNPILYVDLSRLYSIIGFEQKAIKNMSIALNIAKENRFILRAASRLYARFGLLDYIHKIIKKSNAVKYDPWIMSTEIALAKMMNRSSSFVKKGLKMISSGSYSPFSLTELASSIGTLEFYNGSRKNAKKLLKISMISPNDNSLAQVKWILNQDSLFNINPADFEIDKKYEALALDYYHSENWEEALKNSINWFCDLPFSKRPILFGAHIADIMLDNQSYARKLLSAGLVSHPKDPQIINNMAYSLALENKIYEAESYLNRLQNTLNIENINRICLKATRGLISFRKGFIEEGRRLYYEAIEETKSIHHKHLHMLAILNYAREELLSKNKTPDSIINLVKEIPDKTIYRDVNKIRNDVLRTYNKLKT